MLLSFLLFPFFYSSSLHDATTLSPVLKWMLPWMDISSLICTESKMTQVAQQFFTAASVDTSAFIDPWNFLYTHQWTLATDLYISMRVTLREASEISLIIGLSCLISSLPCLHPSILLHCNHCSFCYRCDKWGKLFTFNLPLSCPRHTRLSLLRVVIGTKWSKWLKWSTQGFHATCYEGQVTVYFVSSPPSITVYFYFPFLTLHTNVPFGQEEICSLFILEIFTARNQSTCRFISHVFNWSTSSDN